MKKITLLLLLFPCAIFAQEDNWPDVRIKSYPNVEYNIPQLYSYMLADKVNLRGCPSDTCKVKAVLNVGQRVLALDGAQNMDTINGIKSYWFNVETETDTGWVWGGFIAMDAFGSQGDPRVKFVFGLKEISNRFDPHGKIYQLRAFKEDKEIARLEIETIAWEYRRAHSIGTKGLSVDDVIIIEIPCSGGCGCTTGDLVIFWNDNEFSEPLKLLGTADAWASESTYFVYPSDMGGEPNSLIKVSDVYLEEMENEYGEFKDSIKREVIMEYWKWDGRKLIPDAAKEKKVIPYINAR